jgi:radical SAM family RiPP maturation amino acid epimerase
VPVAAQDSGEHVAIPPHEPFGLTAANGKRFVERWLADPRFRSALNESPAEATVRFGLDTPAVQLRYVWDDRYRQSLVGKSLAGVIAESPPATRQMFAWQQKNGEYRRRLRQESRPTDPRFAAWRDRQIARSATSFRETYDRNTPHITYAIELSRGCSVGCWFCGVSAPALDSVFRRTPDNARLLREILGALQARVGRKAARHGFLYWASDPLDNPDYEAFCEDFRDVCGALPITTTAVPLRDTQRTRALLSRAARENAIVRFSVSTTRQLDQLHGAFSAIELAETDIVPLNKGSLLQPSISGRPRERLRRQANRNGVELESDFGRDQSIACVSGFLINMVERSVKLITPCNSSERWTLGYYIYQEVHFSDQADFASKIDAMIAAHMPPTLDPERPIGFRSDLVYRNAVDGFELHARYGVHRFASNPLIADVGAALATGGRTPSAIANDFAAAYPVEATVALSWIEEMFDAGLLDEEPPS